MSSTLLRMLNAILNRVGKGCVAESMPAWRSSPTLLSSASLTWPRLVVAQAVGAVAITEPPTPRGAVGRGWSMTG